MSTVYENIPVYMPRYKWVMLRCLLKVAADTLYASGDHLIDVSTLSDEERRALDDSIKEAFDVEDEPVVLLRAPDEQDPLCMYEMVERSLASQLGGDPLEVGLKQG